MTITDQQVFAIIEALLTYEHVRPEERVRHLRRRCEGTTSLHALKPLVDRYLAFMDPPQTCQIEHDHWEGKMICGHALPCPRHGGP